MKDEFDKYIDANRSQIDSEEPNRRFIWEGIQMEMIKKKYNRKIRIWRAAAVLLALLAIGQLSYLFFSAQPAGEPQGQYAAHDSSTGAFEALEASYRQELKLLQKQVASKKIDRSQYAVLYNELAYIDEMEDEFRSDIPLVNDRERLAEILVDTYEKKIRLLERLLQQIERDEKQKAQFREL